MNSIRSAHLFATTAYLYVGDLLSGDTWHEINLGDAVGCWAGAFADASRQLAVGITRTSTFATNQLIDPANPVWEILIIDVATGETRRTLQANTPIAASVGLPNSASEPVSPRVLCMSGASLVFSASGFNSSEGFGNLRWAFAGTEALRRVAPGRVSCAAPDWSNRADGLLLSRAPAREAEAYNILISDNRYRIPLWRSQADDRWRLYWIRFVPQLDDAA